MQASAGSSSHNRAAACATPRQQGQWNFSNSDGDPNAFALVQSTLLQYQQRQQSQHPSLQGTIMQVQKRANLFGQPGNGCPEKRVSTSPTRQAPQRRRLSVDESMAAAGLFVLAQAPEGAAATRETGKTGPTPAVAHSPAPAPTHSKGDKPVARSVSTRKGRRLPRRESGKINDGLQPQILTRDAIVQDQYHHQHQMDSISKSSSAQDKLPSSLSPPLSGEKTIAPAVLYQHQQPHHRPKVYNNFLLHSAQRPSVMKANELLQLRANQQLQAVIQKRNIEAMLRNSSSNGGAAAVMSRYAALQSQLQVHPPAKRVKVNPPVKLSALSAASELPGQRSAPKKRILARKVEDNVPSSPTAVAPTSKARVDPKNLSLAPEEEVDPLSGDLLNPVQNYFPHDDMTAKNGRGGGGIAVPRARAFMISHLGRTAVPQSGYGNLPSWRVAKQKMKTSPTEASPLSSGGALAETAQGRVARDALTKILPSSSPITDGNTTSINMMRGKISALM